MRDLTLTGKKPRGAQGHTDEGYKSSSPGRLVARRFFRSVLAVSGLSVLALIIVFSLFGPLLSPYKQNTMFYTIDDGGEITGERLAEFKDSSPVLNARARPGASHWLGTDAMGRDVLTRLMYGGRTSLVIAFCVVAIELAIGVFLGGVAGYAGGIADMLIMRLVEIFYSIPFIPLMLIISAVMIRSRVSPDYKVYFIIAVMGLLFWPSAARMVRGQVLSLRGTQYMQAAHALGIRPARRFFRHLLPNVMPVIIVFATMDLGVIILTEAVMSYLGVGVPATAAAWGSMISSVSDNYVLRNCWYIWLPPGLCILLTVLSFNFVGDALRDAFDPRTGR